MASNSSSSSARSGRSFTAVVEVRAFGLVIVDPDAHVSVDREEQRELSSFRVVRGTRHLPNLDLGDAHLCGRRRRDETLLAEEEPGSHLWPEYHRWSESHRWEMLLPDRLDRDSSSEPLLKGDGYSGPLNPRTPTCRESSGESAEDEPETYAEFAICSTPL